jgi:amidase
MLDVLAGTARYRDPQPLSGLRIAFSSAHPAPGIRAKPAITGALDRARQALQEAGHRVSSARVPYPPTLGLRFSGRWLAGIAQDADGLPAGKLEDRTRKMAAMGARLAPRVKPVADDAFGARMRAWFSDYDALVTPVLTRPPVPVGTWAGKGWIRTMLSVGNWLYTVPWNLARLPAACVPFGGTGLQLVGPPDSEGTLLSLAAQLEQCEREAR